MRVFRCLCLSVLGSVIFLGFFIGLANASSQPAELDSPTGRIIYVNIENFPGAKPSADGSSWSNAYQYLQSALLVADAGDQIWVAQGVYYPDEGPGQTDNDRNSTFRLKNGVAVYGGFDPGNGADTFEERDWRANVTVLSGDIDKNDTVDPDGVVITTTHISDSNAYHAVSSSGISATTVLDGFVITAGKADGPFSEPCCPACGVCGLACGGGMYNDNYSNPTLTDVTFSGNLAVSRGGGMHNYFSSPTLTNASFSGNSANIGGGMDNYISSSPTLTNVTFSGNSAKYGGGIYNDNTSNSHPTLTNVTFSSNSADYGGGMYNNFSNPMLTDVTFSDNKAEQDGGGMYNFFSSPMLTNASFSGNSADYGGGMYNTESSDPTLIGGTFSGNWADWDGGGLINSNSHPTLTDVTFSDNLAYDEGGGMRNYESSPTLNGVTFYGNLALTDGGGISNHTSSPTLTNVIFSGNTASDDGGGICNYYQSSPILTNVTFASNRSFSDGGGMFNENNSNPSLTNTIFWGNLASSSGNQIRNDSLSPASSPTIHNSDIQGSGGSASWDTWLGSDGGGNIDSAPQFVRDPNGGGDGFGDNPYTTGVDESANDDYGDLHLQSGSPAIDTGTNTGCPTTDLDGIPRPVGSRCDMGAYEWFTAGVTLEPDRSGSARPGRAVTYLHTLTNNGNFSDTFTLVTTSSQGWTVKVKPDVVTVGMSTSTTIEVNITIPADASSTDVTTITATSNADDTVSDSVTDTTSVSFCLYLPLVIR